jgi:hypothetical protein
VNSLPSGPSVLPLYYYLNDTAAKPNVTGALAILWPPLTSASPAATGTSGQLAAVKDIRRLPRPPALHLGRRPRRPGIEDFFVATPGLTPIAGTSTPASTTPAPPTSSGNGY